MEAQHLFTYNIFVLSKQYKGMENKEQFYWKTKVLKIVDEFSVRPDWIAGFVGGEGCFTAYSFKQKNNRKYPYQIQPALIGVQHKCDISVLYRLKQYFNSGQVSKNTGKNDIESDVWQWRVRDIKILCNVIIPFFEKHVLLTTKDEEFMLFKELCFKIRRKSHLKSIDCYNDCVLLLKSIFELRQKNKGKALL